MAGQDSTLGQFDSRGCASNLFDMPAHSPKILVGLLAKTLAISVSGPAKLGGFLPQSQAEF